MRRTDCDLRELRAYLRGDLDDESCSRVEAHALECDNCRSVIEQDIAGVADSIRNTAPECEIPSSVHLRVRALSRQSRWQRVVASISPRKKRYDDSQATTAFSPAGETSTAITGMPVTQPNGVTRSQFFKQVLTTGGFVGASAVSVGAYGLDRFRHLESKVALITLNFPHGTFNPADDLNEVNLVVEAPGSKTPLVLRQTAAVIGDRAQLLALPGGFIKIAAERQAIEHLGPASFYWQGNATGEMEIKIPFVRPGDTLYDVASSLLRGVTHSAAEINVSEIERQRSTFVGYRNITLAVNGQILLSEDFSQVEERGLPTSLIRYWAGYSSAVTRAFGDPAFVLEFLPNHNEGWSFPLPFVRADGTIRYGLEIMTPDAARGGEFGLYGMLGAVNSSDACEIELKDGKMTIHGHTLLQKAEPWHWYKVEVVYNSSASTADISIDGVLVANGISVPGGRVDGFMISGVNYAIPGVDVP